MHESFEFEKLSIKKIQQHCEKPEFKNFCLTNRNIIAKFILQKYGFVIAKTANYDFSHILRLVHDFYNPKDLDSFKVNKSVVKHFINSQPDPELIKFGLEQYPHF